MRNQVCMQMHACYTYSIAVYIGWVLQAGSDVTIVGRSVFIAPRDNLSTRCNSHGCSQKSHSCVSPRQAAEQGCPRVSPASWLTALPAQGRSWWVQTFGSSPKFYYQCKETKTESPLKPQALICSLYQCWIHPNSLKPGVMLPYTSF